MALKKQINQALSLLAEFYRKLKKSLSLMIVVVHLLLWTGILLAAFLLNGCATATKSLALGGTIGAGVGALAGGIADPGNNGELRTRNVIIGSALGGVAGMITSGLLHDASEDNKREAFFKGQQSVKVEPKPGVMPALKNPKVEARWMEGKIVGNRYIEGHFEYVILEPARWETGE